MLILEIFVVVFVLESIKQPYDICTKYTITCSKIIVTDHHAYLWVLFPEDFFF